MTNTVASTNAADLIPYTGFYALSSGSGSFLLIDTNFIYNNGAITYEASITISTDGVSSDKYDFAQCCTFADNVLTVSNGTSTVASVTLSSVNSGGVVSALSGTVGGVQVTGTTPFNPIEIDVFAAEYYETLQTSGGPVYVAKFRINTDGSIAYRPDDGGDLVPVQLYAYNYAMFVIEFAVAGKTITFEMGTAPGSGRVAGNSANGSMLISIGKVTPYPPMQATPAPQLADAQA